ncbi:hypothetical protein [Microseira sp. BLCC-F43]|uniref:hypothetical protein n=1 Tax=Microseira sp. BLCC-F43 TaxID=3153602 RepID=UPI0035BB14B7
MSRYLVYVNPDTFKVIKALPRNIRQQSQRLWRVLLTNWRERKALFTTQKLL